MQFGFASFGLTPDRTKEPESAGSMSCVQLRVETVGGRVVAVRWKETEGKGKREKGVGEEIIKIFGEKEKRKKERESRDIRWVERKVKNEENKEC